VIDPELETYRRELRFILDQTRATLSGLTAEQLNWRPDTGHANSAYAIASHVVGSTRAYALGFGCGRPVERDRAAEFAASGTNSAGLIAAIGALADEIDAAVAAEKPATLDGRFRPSRELWGTGEIHEITGRDAFVECIRHAALHLGELRLTRDLALRSV
jgi:hypothetical protein